MQEFLIALAICHEVRRSRVSVFVTEGDAVCSCLWWRASTRQPCRTTMPSCAARSWPVSNCSMCAPSALFVLPVFRTCFLTPVCLQRGPYHMTVEIGCKPVQFKLLHVFRFSSDRARMSVVVERPDGRVVVYTKGSDERIRSLLSEPDSELARITFQHVDDYAVIGLRTLCLGCRELEADEYARFQKALRAAETQSLDRAAAIERTWDLLECDLQLMGATAIEDCLQKEVPETIHALIKVCSVQDTGRQRKLTVWGRPGSKYGCSRATSATPQSIFRRAAACCPSVASAPTSS